MYLTIVRFNKSRPKLSLSQNRTLTAPGALPVRGRGRGRVRPERLLAGPRLAGPGNVIHIVLSCMTLRVNVIHLVFSCTTLFWVVLANFNVIHVVASCMTLTPIGVLRPARPAQVRLRGGRAPHAARPARQCGGRRRSGVNTGQRELKVVFGDIPKRGWCGVLLTLVSRCPRSLRDLSP